MFEKLRAALRSKDTETEAASAHKDHQIAAAVLLIEAATLDGIFGEVEKETIAVLLAQRFDFDQTATSELIETAIEHHGNSVEIFSFTRQIKDHFDEVERVEMIEMLWEVVYADDHLHDFEANLLRRVTGLLHVPDRASGEAKKRVRARLGLT
jgi:uncharacterized tellurite resistance protein B-like protein